MSNVVPAYVTVNPHMMIPEIILQYQQASGAFEALEKRTVDVRLGTNDLAVYMKRLNLRTVTAGGQSAYNQLPSCTVQAEIISAPTYLLRVRAEYDHHDTAALASYGASISEAQRLSMRQGIFQQMRNALLYGMNPANGEGLLNTPGVTAVNLPPDPNGNDTVVTYDAGAFAEFFLSQVAEIKTRTMQVGYPARIVIVGPQRVIAQLQYVDIVQLTQFQRVGAGSLTSTGVVEAVGAMNDDGIEWECDDTLIGKGAGGTDAVIITIPEIKKPKGRVINTNEFAKLTPGLNACNVMYSDMAAPREIPTPLAGGAIDILSEIRITSGWAVRPEATTVVSMQFQ